MKIAVKCFAVIISLCCHVTRARWRRFQEGDFLIGALFPVTTGSDCSVVQSEGLALVEAFVFAVDKINANKSRSLVSDVSLGYDIRDSCASTTVAMNEVVSILGLEHGMAPKICSLNGAAKQTKNCGVIAVVGPDSSPGVMATSGVLSAFEVPQIIYGAGSLLLSRDKLIDRSLFQTCPSDAQLVASLASIVAYFGWSCINVISSREDSDSTALERLKQTLKTHNVCAVLGEAVDLEDIPRIVSKIRSQYSVSVTVLLGKGSFVSEVLREARKQNLTKEVWIAPKQWNKGHLVENYGNLIDGMLWLSEPKVDLGEFKARINLLHKNSSEVFCAWLEKHNRWNALCGQNDGKRLRAINLKGCSLVKVPHVINAVFAVAHGLQQLAVCVTGQANTASCPVGNLTLHQLRERLISALTSTSFNSLSNVSVTFKSNGEVNAKYDVMNSYRIDNKNWASVCIGRWTDKKGLLLKNKRIRWPGNEPHAPYSRCSDRCPLGTITKCGVVTCLWECQKCPYGTYNDNFTATHCKTCPRERMPNAEQSRCIKKPPAVVDPYGWLAIVFLLVCGLGETLTLLVLGVFVRYQNTPVVKATNLTFTMMTLILLLAWFLIPVLYIGKPTDLTCKLRTVSFCVLYTTVTSVLLAKTNRLIRIFSAFKKTCFLTNCWYGFLTCALILVQFVMSAVYLVLFPPKVAYDFSLPRSVIVKCNEHIVLDLATLAYNVLLSIMCGYLAFKSRKLPRAYNKGKWICLATFTNFVSWVIILIGRHLSPLGMLNAVLTILALTAGAYLMLALLFLPKIRVIFFRPEKNTKQAAIESTRRYSLEQASGIDLSPVQGSRSAARRHTSPACLTLQLVNGPGVKSAASKSSLGQRRSHVSLIGTIKELPEERKDDCKL